MSLLLLLPRQKNLATTGNLSLLLSGYGQPIAQPVANDGPYDAGVPSSFDGVGDFGQASQTFDAVGASILNITGSGAFGQGSQTSAGVVEELFSGSGSFGQGSGTFAGTGSAGANAITGSGDFAQGAGTFDALLSGGTPSKAFPIGGLGGVRKDYEETLRRLDKAEHAEKRRKRLLAMLLLMSQ